MEGSYDDLVQTGFSFCKVRKEKMVLKSNPTPTPK
jgi:hypothetical protein